MSVKKKKIENMSKKREKNVLSNIKNKNKKTYMYISVLPELASLICNERKYNWMERFKFNSCSKERDDGKENFTELNKRKGKMKTVC